MDIRKAIAYFEEELKRDCIALSPILEGKKSVRAQFFETAISAMQELQRYRQIGTPEECRTAMEKQQAMKVTDIHVDEYYCPACGAENCCDQGIIGDKYCPECGQALERKGQ